MRHDHSVMRKLLRGGSAPRPPGFSALGLRQVGLRCHKKGCLARSSLCRMATDRRSGRFPALPYPPAGSFHHSRAHAPREVIASQN
jgi:hypothetical protein